ncbi:MAG: hypothetical protein EVG15_06545 [Candidatus Acididesulfobacter diazotrophicus]|jgi:hypothetical protein|uniref:Type IV conjugative transfer system protein TraL n=1 Tax=Candidatus Acididesulfobacter diazotrophicus TaxID=2597226 RepID=A0A519BMB0_9DELT|nr:MAG: hypothetical protein EVG15_06545 [Candidatus Acididesulfobacter diazotrophicus]
MSFTNFKIHRGIHEKVTKLGLELYDWGLYIFLTMFIILLLKKEILITILLDLLIFIFLKKYKKGKPDFYTTTLINYFFITKKLFVFEPHRYIAETKNIIESYYE